MDPALALETRFCFECGRPWPPDDLARFGDRLICPECKTTFAQKLREGAASAAGFQYAGFWVRFAAVVIDTIILGVANTVLQFSLMPLMGGREPRAMLAAVGVLSLLGMVVHSLYEGLFVARLAATPGKMALGLKVVRPDGSAVLFGRAYARYFAKILSALTLMIGYLMAATDPERRALHDRICDTRVIVARH